MALILWFQREPSTKEDLVLFAGPLLGLIRLTDWAPRIYLDKSFRQDRSIAHDFAVLARDVELIVGANVRGSFATRR